MGTRAGPWCAVVRDSCSLAHRGRCAGAAAGCGGARVSDLLVPTWETSTTAAGVLEAKET
eukprot:732349-Prymnesium_polylepis.2